MFDRNIKKSHILLLCFIILNIYELHIYLQVLGNVFFFHFSSAIVTVYI